MRPRPSNSTDRAQQELELLAVRCQLGEPDAFTELAERFHEPLWRYVLGTCGDPAVAEDVLQEGWLRILRGIDRLREPARLRSWIFSIVRRTFIDRLRRRYADQRFESLADGPEAAGDGSPDEPVDVDTVDADVLAWEDLDLLRAELDRLTPADRETVALFYLHELDLREVAEILAVPVGTVKSRLHRARRQLHDALAAQGVSR